MEHNGRSYEQGLAIRRHVLGDRYVDEALAQGGPIGRSFQRLVTEHVWGEIWARPGLPARTRSLITLAVLSALNQSEELALHVAGAIRNGCSPADIEEALMQAGAYCGASATATAFRVANRVLTEMASQPAGTPE